MEVIYGTGAFSFLVAFRPADALYYGFECLVCFLMFPDWDHLMAHPCVSCYPDNKAPSAPPHPDSSRQGHPRSGVFSPAVEDPKHKLRRQMRVLSEHDLNVHATYLPVVNAYVPSRLPLATRVDAPRPKQCLSCLKPFRTQSLCYQHQQKGDCFAGITCPTACPCICVCIEAQRDVFYTFLVQQPALAHSGPWLLPVGSTAQLPKQVVGCTSGNFS